MGEAPLQVKVEEVQGVGIRGEQNVARRGKELLHISKFSEKKQNKNQTNFA